MRGHDVTRKTSRRRKADRAATRPAQPPWQQLIYRQAPVEILSADEVERIHRTAVTVLRDIGMAVLSPAARDAYAKAGCRIDGTTQRVRFDPDALDELLKQAPARFTLRARNPARNLEVGGKSAIYSSVGGPAYCMDLDRGRRAGSFAEMCDFLRLVQSLDILHQEGGGGFEALDLPAQTRHLDLYHAQIRLLDKNWQPWGIGRDQALDAINMAALGFGERPEDLAETPVFSCVINSNTPLQWDIPMAEGLMTMAAYGQAVIVTPFTLAGAMAPVTLAGALALQHAEAMAGIALTQIVRPGAPAVYGGFTSNVDMKTGSPAFGTPEYLQAAQASGQLARRLGLPFRSSNTTAANGNDCQAAYESLMSLWGAVTGQAHIIMHAAGWLGGGLTASFEKLILDAELLQMVAASLAPLEVSDETLAMGALREVGPGGHFFGTDHTLARYRDAFYQPLISNWDNYDTWVERGSPNAEQAANRTWKELLKDYRQPPLDPGIDAALAEYVARRKRGEKPEI